RCYRDWSSDVCSSDLDAGCIVAASPSLAPLASGAVLLVHRTDRERIGVADGEHVRLTTTRGTVELPVTADASTPPGTAFLAFARSEERRVGKDGTAAG